MIRRRIDSPSRCRERFRMEGIRDRCVAPLAVTSPECSAGTTAPKRITPQRLATTTARTRAAEQINHHNSRQQPRHRAPIFLSAAKTCGSNIAKSKTTRRPRAKDFVCDNHLRSPATRGTVARPAKRTANIEPARDCFRCAPRNSGRRYSSPAPTRPNGQSVTRSCHAGRQQK